ncbi:proheparin-binding EGF-like growth factor isoform X2 [Electrophorus electricus]|uniref:proheparin-binding EGF-like growth factor isoform X2 n=1 Tax=Electrophorus electricus TaxID=8005 RepID=UPI000F09CEBB|nr:proheparin-binding EGF-like growth factor isoform X2 [Electrophorus electricus]
MHLILLSCLLCVACSVVISSGSFVTHSSELGHVTVMSASGEGLQSAAGDEAETDNNANTSGQPGRKPESHSRRTRRKHGSKKRPRNQVTVGHQSRTHSPTSNPCFSSHKDYCIHGHCTYLQDLEEPVCVCMKGYDGVRCGVHLLQTGSGSGSGGLDKPSSMDSLHMTLIIMAVILSVISCFAILLMICVHYRTQHSFQTAIFSAKPLKSPVV